jgi:hypothetical protein
MRLDERATAPDEDRPPWLGISPAGLGLLLLFVVLLVMGFSFNRAFGIALVATGGTTIWESFVAARQTAESTSKAADGTGWLEPAKGTWAHIQPVVGLALGATELGLGVLLLLFSD